MLTADRAELERLQSLHTDLEHLKIELANAWASPHGSTKVPVLERRIREKWDQIDSLALSLSEPPFPVGARAPAAGASGRA